MNFIARTAPRHMDENLPLDSVLSIQFMMDINQQLLREEHIILTNLTEEADHDVTFDYRSRTMTIYPLKELHPKCHYQLTILGGNDGIRNIIGAFMPESHCIEFYTADVKEIKPPILLSPTHLSEYSSSVEFRWDAIPTAALYELQISRTNTFHHLVWPPERMAIYDTSVVPKIAYEKGNYYARIRSVSEEAVKSAYSPVTQFYFDSNPKFIEDDPEADPIEKEKDTQALAPVTLQANTMLISTSTSLSTLQKHFKKEQVKEQNGFGIVYGNPTAKALNIPLAQLKEITIEFSEDIDENSITDRTCYLIGEKN